LQVREDDRSLGEHTQESGTLPSLYIGMQCFVAYHHHKNFSNLPGRW
jgi:hypothetical protein